MVEYNLICFSELRIHATSSVRLSVNRRLGKGCSTQLTFVKHDGSTSIFEYDYYDGTSVWSRLRELAWSYVRIVANPPVLLGTLLTVFLVLAGALLLTLVFMRRRSFGLDKLNLNSNLVSLKNVQRRYHNQTGRGASSGFGLLRNQPEPANLRSQQHPALMPTSEMREHEQKYTSAAVASCPRFEDLDHQQHMTHSNDFQVLRDQLITTNT